MKEQLISLETAKLAKEKGFKTSYHSYYFEDGEFREHKIETSNGYYGDIVIYEQEEFYGNWNDAFLTAKNGNRCFGCNKSQGYFETYTAPSQSLLQKWLREKHNIHVEINFMSRTLPFHHGYFIILRGIGHELNLDNDSQGNYRPILSEIHGGYEIFNSYEEALEKGLQEALKLI